MEIWIYWLTKQFSPMLHYTWRATRNMGKATYFYAFRFFLPTFFCSETETTVLHMLIITPVSLHPLSVRTQLLSLVSHSAWKLQRGAGSDPTAPLPVGGLGTNSCVSIYKPMLHHCYSLDLSKNLHHRCLIAKLRVPDEPFQRTRRKPTLKRSEEINRTALQYFASSCTFY